MKHCGTIRDRNMNRITRDQLAAKIAKLGLTTREFLADEFGDVQPHTPRGWSFSQGLAELVRSGHVEFRGRLLVAKIAG